MASIILSKEDRLAYIKEAAARIREEKAYVARLCNEVAVEPVDCENDFSLVEEFCGMVSTGVARVHGGLRKMPVIIL